MNPLTPAQQLAYDAILKFGQGIAPSDLMAFCEIESSFNPLAYRYEPKISDASYGLMQILASTARGQGFTGSTESLLYDEGINITYGAKQVLWIADYIGKHGANGADPGNRAACYNAGVGNFLHGFVPSLYVARYSAARQRWTENLA